MNKENVAFTAVFFFSLISIAAGLVIFIVANPAEVTNIPLLVPALLLLVGISGIIVFSLMVRRLK